MIDSLVILSCISNEVWQFKPIVANRVQFIRESTDVPQWHYVSSQSNPADYGSRGLNVINLEKIRSWFSGPSFLWSKDTDWLNSGKINPVRKEYLELKKVRVNFIMTDNSIISSIGFN